jgi:hypothetical protein
MNKFKLGWLYLKFNKFSYSSYKKPKTMVLPDAFSGDISNVHYYQGVIVA